jgi:hypothetical protein
VEVHGPTTTNGDAMDRPARHPRTTADGREDVHPVWDGAPTAPTWPSSHDPDQLATGWRVLSGIGAALAAGGVVLSWFAGIVVFTGCFIKCDPASADPVSGLLLFGLSAACLVVATVGVKLAVTGRVAGSARVAGIAAVVGALGIVVTAAGG